jgi:hypothetical protein
MNHVAQQTNTNLSSRKIQKKMFLSVRRVQKYAVVTFFDRSRRSNSAVLFPSHLIELQTLPGTGAIILANGQTTSSHREARQGPLILHCFLFKNIKLSFCDEAELRVIQVQRLTQTGNGAGSLWTTNVSGVHNA